MSAKNLKIALMTVLSVGLMGCAGFAPLPGGKDTVNHEFYESDEDMRTLVSELKVGMSRDDVFNHLNRQEDDFVLLNRREIIETLYGGHYVNVSFAKDSPMNNPEGLKSLAGYKLFFKKVNRKHGISSPIAMRTNEIGYNYQVALIFKDGHLFEEPIVSGGVVDASSTKTIFDYLSPKTLMGSAGI